MDLLERINKLLKYHKFSRSELARRLEIQQPTLNRYFSENQQEKFTLLLWKIIEIFPEISRNWLFFGEGDMLDKTTTSPEEVLKLQARIDELEKDLQEEQKLNRRLTNELLDTKKDKIA